MVFWHGTGKTGFNQAFADKRIAEFPGGGPRGIAIPPGAIAVIFYGSSEVKLIAAP